VTLASALPLLIGITTVVGHIGILIAAFRTGILWGLGCLLFPPVTILFVIMHWDEARVPFIIMIMPLLLLVSFGFIAGAFR
jgi:hypothetical protein